MSTFSRQLGRWDLLRVAAVVLGLAWLAVLAAFGYAAYLITPGTGTLVAAAALVVIAGAGILYAWREPRNRNAGA
jgi:hypothetical protein